MRLLYQAKSGFQLTDIISEGKEPPYAILSHTWNDDENQEVTLKDIQHGLGKDKSGYEKLSFCANQAKEDGLKFFWIDTCCMDKDSSYEVQESIAKMFSWYQRATQCYVYLTDVSSTSPDGTKMNETHSYPWEGAFRACKWFTRGWTLQELLAPQSVKFFSVEGRFLGDKCTLARCIHEVTGIPETILRGESLANYSLAKRLFWSAARITKRIEDKAYSLLGILGISMLLGYGEGEGAWHRLRQEIEKRERESTELDQYLECCPSIPAAALTWRSAEESTCLQGTRTEVLLEIKTWISGSDQKCIYWLSGVVGTGKSTVSRTVGQSCTVLQAEFFFSENDADLSNAKHLIPTLAWQLALKDASLKSPICTAFKDEDNIIDTSMENQWKSLIIKPLSNSKINRVTMTILFTIDSLDQCTNEQHIQDMLRIFSTNSSLNNIQFRFLISCRATKAIRDSFAKVSNSLYHHYVLHDMSTTSGNSDLRKFFEVELACFGKRQFCDANWLDCRSMTRLVELSSGLFLWASIACRFICEGGENARSRVKDLLDHHSTLETTKPFNDIYRLVFQDLIRRGCYTEKHREILGSIVALVSPPSMDSLARILNIDLKDLKETLADLHTIFCIPKDSHRPIRLHHPTLNEFLLDQSQADSLDVAVSPEKAHKTLADHCMRIMTKELRRNICDLSSSEITIKNIPREQIAHAISPELQYACLNWISHFKASKVQLFEDNRVQHFFQDYFFCWLEVMSLIGKATEMASCLRLYEAIHPSAQSNQQRRLIRGARRFVAGYGQHISEYPLSVYQDDYRTSNMTQGGVKMKSNVSYVNALSFTPDSKFLASGSNFEAVRMWSVNSKTAYCKFEGESTDKISAVTISPDGSMIAAGSDDHTVSVWDIKTRKLRYVLRGHTHWVNSVNFSPDGLILVSGSMDQSVILWDIEDGTLLKKINNQSSCVNSSAFSHDGIYLATGSVDRIVRIWNLSSQTEIPLKQFHGHTGCINSVKFSNDSKFVISASDDMTIKQWDMTTDQEVRTLSGHKGRITTVTYSPDGVFIVSGAEDTTIRLWDPTSGAELRTGWEHTSGVNALVFSTDGKLLASSSIDGEVRLWDATKWQCLGKLEEFENTVGADLLDMTQFHSHISHPRPVDNSITAPLARLNTLREEDSIFINCTVYSSDGRTLPSAFENIAISQFTQWVKEGAARFSLGPASINLHIQQFPSLYQRVMPRRTFET